MTMMILSGQPVKELISADLMEGTSLSPGPYHPDMAKIVCDLAILTPPEWKKEDMAEGSIILYFDDCLRERHYEFQAYDKGTKDGSRLFDIITDEGLWSLAFKVSSELEFQQEVSTDDPWSSALMYMIEGRHQPRDSWRAV